MKFQYVHPWSLAPREAVALQDELRGRLRLTGKLAMDDLSLVAGADVSFHRATNTVFAAVVVLSYPRLETVEMATAVREADFPYVPGLLAFREGPALEEAFASLRNVPRAVLFDGHGIAHPRGMGIACHFGLILGCPTVGVAKSLLVGGGEDPGPEPGDSSPLEYKGKVVGILLRTRRRVKPVYVSVGYGLDLDAAKDLVLRCLKGYRLPEPTRLAHIESNRLRLEHV
ncbi:deoxyribonuclease V [Desulforudis sp. 1088]|uniref:deoxyribonuclease V n=1 Tax=unclassified Candidatus Desulforudis TaxID=2635950 RepID=UPI0034922459